MFRNDSLHVPILLLVLCGTTTTNAMSSHIATMISHINAVYQSCPFDVLLLIDVSGFEDLAFNRTIDTLTSALGGLPDVAFNMGIITFSEFSRTYRVLSPVTNMSRAMRDISSIRLRGGGSSALTAVNLALNTIRSRGRQDANKLVVLASDGNSGVSDRFDWVRVAGTKLQALPRTTVVALTHNPQHYLPELELYAGRNVYTENSVSLFAPMVRKSTVRECDLRHMLRPLIPVVAPQGACPIDVHLIIDMTSGEMIEELRTVQRDIALASIRYFSSDDFGTWTVPVRVRVGALMIDRKGIHILQDIALHSNKSAVMECISNGLKADPDRTILQGLVNINDAFRMTIDKVRNVTDKRVAVVYIGGGNTMRWDQFDEAGRQLRANANAVVFGVSVLQATNTQNMNALTGINNRIFTYVPAVHLGYRRLSDYLPDFYAYANDADHCQQQFKRPSHVFCDVDVMMLMQTTGLKKAEFDANRQLVDELLLQVSDQDIESERIGLSIITTDADHTLLMPFAPWKRKEYVRLALSTVTAQTLSRPNPLISETMVAAINEALRARRKNSLLLVMFIGNGNYETETFQSIRDTSRIWDRLPNTLLLAVSPSRDSYQPALAAITGDPSRVFADVNGKKKFLSSVMEYLNVPGCVNSRPRLIPGGTR